MSDLGGYLNEHGTLNVKRLQLVLNELNIFETEHFEHEFADSNWYKGKNMKSSSKGHHTLDRTLSGKLGEWGFLDQLGGETDGVQC